jgi:dTDP-4-amino-4,6-dideoxygalactose transaminase
MRVSDYLGYLRDMSRKIAFRGGFEACLIRPSAGGMPVLHGSSSANYGGLSRDTWLAQARQRLEREDNLGVYVGYGLIAGRVTVDGRSRDVAGPLIIVPVDMERVLALAAAHGLRVVEDCAQATGASWAGRPVGSWGDVGCFSFFPTKNLGGAGDGGAITCRDPELAQRLRELAVHGMPRRYLHTALGYNSRLDAIQATVLNVKLPHLPRWVKHRGAIASQYHEHLAALSGVCLPEAGPEGHSWNQFVLRVPACSAGVMACGAEASCTPSADSAAFGLPQACCRDWLKQQLQEAGVSTIIYYPIPIHRQPAYAELGYGPGSLPVTERLCTEVLSLPIFPELSGEQQQRVIEVLRAVLAQPLIVA